MKFFGTHPFYSNADLSHVLLIIFYTFVKWFSLINQKRGSVSCFHAENITPHFSADSLPTQENSQVQRQVHMEEVERQLTQKMVVRN